MFPCSRAAKRPSGARAGSEGRKSSTGDLQRASGQPLTPFELAPAVKAIGIAEGETPIRLPRVTGDLTGALLPSHLVATVSASEIAVGTDD
jgi:hypothetical protein